MYYNGLTGITAGPGKHIGLATAGDPSDPWTRSNDPVLSAGTSGEWDAGGIDPGSILKTDSGYLMFYYGCFVLPVSDGSIGMAYSVNGIEWVKYDDPSTTSSPYADSDPILVCGDIGNWDELGIFKCCVMKSWSGFEMFYGGSDFSLNYGIGYATSLDGILWTKHYEIPPYTFIDDPYASLFGYHTLEFPSVTKDSSVYRTFYDYGFTIGEIGMATADIAVSNYTGQNKRSGNLMIFPNPCSSSATIEYRAEFPGEYEITIMDHLGKINEKILSDIRKGKNKIRLDTGSLLPGIYFCRITSGKQFGTCKLVKIN